LRPVEVVPATVGGEKVIILRDPSGVSEAALTVGEDLLYVLQFFDGKHSSLDIRTEYMRRFGRFLFEERLREIIDVLDENLLLDSEHFAKRVKEIREEFSKGKVREAHHAGTAYPAERAELAEMLAGFFSSGESSPGTDESVGVPGALLVPHIDLRTGGKCAARAYRELVRSEPPELFVILGTGHAGARNGYVLTRKSFRTPFGVARTDREFLDELAERTVSDFFEDELIHRAEHSIEFQVVFIQYVFGELLGKEVQPEIVPILCSFGHEDVEPGKAGGSGELIEGFCSALSETIRKCGKKICVVSSVDFAHVGPRYGDREGLSEADRAALKSEDARMISLLQRWDKAGFVEMIVREQNRRRICGFPPLFTMLSVLEPMQGRFLCYDQAEMGPEGSVVSFGSIVYS